VPGERIYFHFDPLCPWAWITSRWATRLEELGEIEIEWRLFSLGVANLQDSNLAPEQPVGRSAAALQLLAQSRRAGGNEAVRRLYTTIGDAAHVRGEDISSHEVLAQAWTTADFDVAFCTANDPTLWQEVLTDHRAAVSACQAFGVPTLILDDGKGQGIFGPVITEVPSDDESRELLQDILRMLRRGYFFELKREREGHPPKTGR
jgi:predicted DsbA family dithiol-disulfide isomerase